MSTSEVYEPYLLRASNGERRDAFQAGNIPAAMLKTTERIHTLRIMGNKDRSDVSCSCSSSPWARWSKIRHYISTAATPTAIAKVDPMRPISNASLKNSKRIKVFFAPIAFIVPISFILSLTDV